MEEKILELVKGKQYVQLRELLEGINSADLAAYMEELENEQKMIVFRLLGKEQAAETFTHMEKDEQEKLIHAMTDRELAEVMDELYLDDTVDLVEEMPASIVKRILRNADAEQRKLINEFLNYPPDSAGSLMTIEFVDLKSTMTVDEAFLRIRRTGIDKETIYTCYVLGASRELEGVVTVRELLLADGQEKIADLMETNLIQAHTLQDREEVAKMFTKYDLNALPVVDNEQRLVGIITIDDAVDVIQEENTEDFEKMAALTPSEDNYFNTSVLRHAKNRIFWLVFLMLSATLSGTLINHYEAALSSVPLLIAFIPMLMDIGGNCSSQSSTLVIRGMTIDEIETKDVFKVAFKELRIALLVGVCLALINGVRIGIQYASQGNSVILAVTVGISIICTCVLAKMLGCLLPMAAQKLHMDPAIMAAPLLTTVLDTCSLFIFFNIAKWIMRI